MQFALLYKLYTSSTVFTWPRTKASSLTDNTSYPSSWLFFPVRQRVNTNTLAETAAKQRIKLK